MGKARKQWTDQQMLMALEAIKNGGSINNVSKTWGIPKTTLLYKHTGKVPIGKSSGPAPVLSPAEEALFVKWILYFHQRGFAVTKSRLIDNAEEFIQKWKIKTMFTNGRPGRHWYEAFLRRHPEVPHCSRKIDSETRNWFEEAKALLDEKGLTDIKSSRIFNLNESLFYFNPTGEIVLVKKGDKLGQNAQNEKQECLTVLLTSNAMGQLLPPTVIFKYERIPYSITQSLPQNWKIGKSVNGLLTGETFFDFIVKVFDPFLIENNIQRPVILYVGGHSSHVSFPIADFCLKNQIELISVCPSSNQITQPLDMALFQPLKDAWSRCVQEFCLQNQAKIKREDFGSLLKSSVDSIDLSNIMSDGFRETGLYPFTSDGLDCVDPSMCETQVKVEHTDPQDQALATNVIEFSDKFIDSQLLEQFKATAPTGIWTGDIQHSSLFYFWLNAWRQSTNYYGPN